MSKKTVRKAVLKLTDTPSWNEVMKFWKQFKRMYENGKMDLKHLCFFGLLFTTGLRVSELLALKKEDINLREGIMKVKVQKKRGAKKERMKIREVIISPDVKPYLAKLLRMLKNEERLFDFTRQNAWYLCKKYTGYRCHAFRHAVGIRILTETRDLELVRRILGHERYDVLKAYLDFTLKDRKTEIENALKLI